MTKTLACAPCAKRKVRCDKGTPCSNCKRRKKDSCVYPDESPFDRIKRLESIIRETGGSPQHINTVFNALRGGESRSPSQLLTPESTSAITKPTTGRSQDPVLLQDADQSSYLESRALGYWIGNVQNEEGERDIATRHPLTTSDPPHAFAHIFNTQHTISFAESHPSQRHATVLWSAFKERVRPLVRISFSWALDHLYLRCTNPEQKVQLSNAEHCLMFSLYLVSSMSLSEEECERDLQVSKSTIISRFQLLCEQTLACDNMLCLTDLVALEAITFYMVAGADRLSTKSLWSLMGLVIRSAERLGIHRDGTVLKLSPVQTERRRRLWWQLQHLDLFLAVRAGLTSMTMIADWDAKRPLNIEDDDIGPETSVLPPERHGLTTISYCRFTHYVLEQQRIFFSSNTSRFELSWQANKSIPAGVKKRFIDQLEDGLNKHFLQFCDPIQPIDTLLLISARTLVCGMRLSSLHSSGPDVMPSHGTDGRDDALLDASLKMLEYNIAMNTQPQIQRFRWWAKSMFSWQSFMWIVMAAPKQFDTSRSRRIWEVLAGVYQANPSLSQLSEDRRRAHAANLAVAAWNTCQLRWTSDHAIIKPDFVGELEAKLEVCRQAMDQNLRSSDDDPSQSLERDSQFHRLEDFLAAPDTETFLNFDFQDIDWSLWLGAE